MMTAFVSKLKADLFWGMCSIRIIQIRNLTIWYTEVKCHTVQNYNFT